MVWFILSILFRYRYIGDLVDGDGDNMNKIISTINKAISSGHNFDYTTDPVSNIYTVCQQNHNYGVFPGTLNCDTSDTRCSCDDNLYYFGYDADTDIYGVKFMFPRPIKCDTNEMGKNIRSSSIRNHKKMFNEGYESYNNIDGGLANFGITDMIEKGGQFGAYCQNKGDMNRSTRSSLSLSKPCKYIGRYNGGNRGNDNDDAGDYERNGRDNGYMFGCIGCNEGSDRYTTRNINENGEGKAANIDWEMNGNDIPVFCHDMYHDQLCDCYEPLIYDGNDNKYLILPSKARYIADEEVYEYYDADLDINPLDRSIKQNEVITECLTRPFNKQNIIFHKQGFQNHDNNISSIISKSNGVSQKTDPATWPTTDLTKQQTQSPTLVTKKSGIRKLWLWFVKRFTNSFHKMEFVSQNVS